MATLKKTEIGFQDHLTLNAGQGIAECSKNAFWHSAILSTFIKLSFVFKTFVLSTFERLFYIGFTVIQLSLFLEQ